MSVPLKRATAVVVGGLVALVLIELAAQIGYAFTVRPSLEAQRIDPRHYYQASSDPALCYELQPGYRGERDGKRIAVNRHGIRDDSDVTAYRQSLAVLGDSVPFGINLSQDDTLPARLQALAGQDLKVLNFGTPGYGVEEIARFLTIKYPIYRPQTIYYVLNLNDFSRRDTIYEGADNGLYRTYCAPTLKVPFLIRKAAYRLRKGGQMSSVAWYRWMYEGNKDAGLALIKDMSDYATQNGSRLIVVLFPPAVAFADHQFLLADEFREIGAYLTARRIPNMAPVAEFSEQTPRLEDDTDHFTAEGSGVMAAALWNDLASRRSDVP